MKNSIIALIAIGLVAGGVLFIKRGNSPSTTWEPAQVAVRPDSVSKSKETPERKEISSSEPPITAAPGPESVSQIVPELVPAPTAQPSMDRQAARPEAQPRQGTPSGPPLGGREPPREMQPMEISVPDARIALGFVGADRAVIHVARHINFRACGANL